MRRLTPLWLFILLFIAAIVYLPGLSKYLKLKRREANLDRETRGLQSEIAQSREEERLIKTDPVRFEQAVREELGLVRPGEVIYKVVEEEIPVVRRR